MRIGINKKGLPKVLKPLHPFIESRNPTDIRFILTVLSISRLIPGDGKLDLTNITSPPSYNEEKLKELSRDLIEKSKWFLNKLEISSN